MRLAIVLAQTTAGSAYEAGEQTVTDRKGNDAGPGASASLSAYDRRMARLPIAVFAFILGSASGAGIMTAADPLSGLTKVLLYVVGFVAIPFVTAAVYTAVIGTLWPNRSASSQ